MSKDLEKVTIRLRDGDATYLASVFPKGYNWAIRTMVEKFVNTHREAMQRTAAMPDLEMEIDLSV